MKTENWAIVASVLAGLSLAGFFAAPSLIGGPPRDQETLCPKTGPVGHTLILVDKSDPWSQVQAGRLRALVKQIGETLPADRMLSIYVFNDVFEPGFPALISLCNPGRTVSELIGNPRREYVRWVEKFGRPLDEALTVLTQPGKGNQSPILEAVGDVVSRRENRVATGERRLLLVSDMLQNSGQFTVFGNAAGARDPERLRRLVDKVWREAGAGAWTLGIHQVQGVYEPARLEQAAALWKDAFRKLDIAVDWDRL
ncbi:hypothetical protein [Bosea sp. (in: a-proteobacteria)]|uniref:hypothetical protein n=1 Tax=Bosea sp. (in: a-proteobacteria) TaxID=1871050 RepID=UPI0026129E8D|nr:hypothetical protein [Bosea sp. (in: a-proteobacteria)]MCO5092605.1 hypothetical protein [Bosea sp. (in: a-proteobacteria)]